MAISFLGLLILMILGVFGFAAVLIIVRLLSPQRPVEYAEAAPYQGRRSGVGLFALFLSAGAVLLALLVMGSWVSVRQGEVTETHQVALARPVRVETVSEESGISHSSEVVSEKSSSVPERGTVVSDAVSEDGTADESALPAWTQTPEKTLVVGQVPTVRRVVSSGLYATPDEATRVAYQKVQSELRSRLAASYPQVAGWTIPQPTLQAHCIKQTHVEIRETQFGQYKEPMYQVWLQFEDSPHVREPIVAEWERSAVDGRTVLFAAGAGLAALFLGTLSAGVRTMIAPSGSKGRAAFATVALGVGTGLAALTLFVG